MKEQNTNISSSNLKSIVKSITEKAQKRGLIRPLSEAFEDVPVKEEIHKGKKQYFCD